MPERVPSAVRWCHRVHSVQHPQHAGVQLLCPVERQQRDAMVAPRPGRADAPPATEACHRHGAARGDLLAMPPGLDNPGQRPGPVPYGLHVFPGGGAHHCVAQRGPVPGQQAARISLCPQNHYGATPASQPFFPNEVSVPRFFERFWWVLLLQSWLPLHPCYWNLCTRPSYGSYQQGDARARWARWHLACAVL